MLPSLPDIQNQELYELNLLIYFYLGNLFYFQAAWHVIGISRWFHIDLNKQNTAPILLAKNEPIR